MKPVWAPPLSCPLPGTTSQLDYLFWKPYLRVWFRGIQTRQYLHSREQTLSKWKDCYHFLRLLPSALSCWEKSFKPQASCTECTGPDLGTVTVWSRGCFLPPSPLARPCRKQSLQLLSKRGWNVLATEVTRLTRLVAWGWILP